MKPCVRMAAGGVLLASLALCALADEVYLKTGRKFEGVAEVKGDQLILRLERGSLTFNMSDVERIETKTPPWEVYEAKAKALKPEDVAGHLALAKWCRENALRARMAQEYEAVLKADPANAEAHGALGHEQVDGKWMSREEALKAKGFVQIEGGIWLGPQEYEAYRRKKETEEQTKKLIEAERAQFELLGDKDADKAAAARKRYLDLGGKAVENLLWGASESKNAAARLEAYKLVDKIGQSAKLEPRQSQVLALRAALEDDANCRTEICRGIKARKDDEALGTLVYLSAGDYAYRRRAAYALRLINDPRAYRALIGCIAATPKNTLPGQMGLDYSFGKEVNTFNSGTGNTTVQGVSGSGIDMGEVVPAADSLEYISGKEYKNDILLWLKWVDAVERAPGGALIDVGNK